MFKPQQGDIYLVDFDPSVGREFQKQRPALVIQSNKTLNNASLITVMALTSNTKNKQNDDILVLRNDKNNLFCDSLVKVQAIHAFDRQRFVNKIGKVDLGVLTSVKCYIQKHFGF